jgi:hypothetical protein
MQEIQPNAPNAQVKPDKRTAIQRVQDSPFIDAFIQWDNQIPKVENPYTIDKFLDFLKNEEKHPAQQEHISDFISYLLGHGMDINKLKVWATSNNIDVTDIDDDPLRRGSRGSVDGSVDGSEYGSEKPYSYSALSIALRKYNDFEKELVRNASRLQPNSEFSKSMRQKMTNYAGEYRDNEIKRIKTSKYGNMYDYSIWDLFHQIEPYASLDVYHEIFIEKIKVSINETVFSDVYQIGARVDHFANIGGNASTLNTFNEKVNTILYGVIKGILDDLYEQCEKLDEERCLVKLETTDNLTNYTTPNNCHRLDLGFHLKKLRGFASVALLPGDGTSVENVSEKTEHGQLFISKNDKHLHDKGHIKLSNGGGYGDNENDVLCRMVKNTSEFWLIRTELPYNPNKIWKKKLEPEDWFHLCHLDVICLGACARTEINTSAPRGNIMYRFYDNNPSEMRLSKVMKCNAEDVDFLIGLIEKTNKKTDKFKNIITRNEKKHIIFKHPKPEKPKTPKPLNPSV